MKNLLFLGCLVFYSSALYAREWSIEHTSSVSAIFSNEAVKGYFGDQQISDIRTQGYPLYQERSGRPRALLGWNYYVTVKAYYDDGSFRVCDTKFFAEVKLNEERQITGVTVDPKSFVSTCEIDW
ncbi:MAG: hypothetical protein A4S09_10835 [Proteobacteria bacterium SG_bin7]|nr:MAG: hypothetical protein A4S09_10835 [Proteobacteria bacterium SG_bin7]